MYCTMKLSSHALQDLYIKAGKEEGLSKILLRFYEKMSQDILIGYFFNGKNLREIAAKQKEFLMKTWGVTASYTGKPPAKAHQNLPQILKGHFDRRLVLLEETLREFGLGDNEIKTWVNFENKFRNAVQDKNA
jgi:truncated hemoglobin YjbI